MLQPESLSHVHTDSDFKCHLCLPTFHRNKTPALVSFSANSNHTVLPIWGRQWGKGNKQIERQFQWNHSKAMAFSRARLQALNRE